MRSFVVWIFLALAFCGMLAHGGDEARVLQNPSFEHPGEEYAVPKMWEGPILLDREDNPSPADIRQRPGFEAEHGDFIAYLRYGSAVPDGWAGLAYEQTDRQFGELVGPGELVLVYRIRYQHGSGVDHISDHAGLVEVEVQSDGSSYRLRYLHPRHGDLPTDSEDTSYVDAGDPGFRAWASYEHDLARDIYQAFPELDSYQVAAVRIGILTRRTSPEEASFYWLFDHVQLIAGD